MVETADAVVIGGGIMGTATAYHLAQRGVKVILLEKTQLGAGSTGRTGGIIRQHYSIETSARMAQRALKVWENFDEVVGGDVGFIKTGIVFVSDLDGVQGISDNVTMMQSIGIRVELMDGQALSEITPYLRTGDVGIAAYEPDAGVADGSMACNAFAARARDLGGQVRQGVEVTAIRLEGERVAGVDTSNGRVDAPVVINTAGPWGPQLARNIGVQVPAEASRHQIASFKLPGDFDIPMHVIVADLINAHYMRAETGGLTLAGSIENDTSDAVPDPDDYGEWVDQVFIEGMVERCMWRLPALERGGVQGGWAGLYTVTPDWSPVIDRVEQIPGLFLALGFSGSGFKMGPVVGEMLADMATSQKQCPIDPSIFRLKRFKAGEDLSSKYGYNIIG
jgi:sarcosine oxidase subunit beta